MKCSKNKNQILDLVIFKINLINSHQIHQFLASKFSYKPIVCQTDPQEGLDILGDQSP